MTRHVGAVAVASGMAAALAALLRLAQLLSDPKAVAVLAIDGAALDDPLSRIVGQAVCLVLAVAALLLLLSGRRRVLAAVPLAAAASAVAATPLVAVAAAHPMPFTADMAFQAGLLLGCLSILALAWRRLRREMGSALRLSLGLTGLIFGGALVLGWSVASWAGYRHELEHAREETETMALSLEEHLRRTLDPAHLLLDQLVERIDAAGLDTVTTDRDERQRLIEMTRNLPQIRALGIADRTGRLRLLTTHRSPPEGISVAELESFTAQRDVGRPFHVGPAMTGGLDEMPLFTVSRRLEDAAGGFAGVAFAALDIAYFRAFYRSQRREGVSVLGLYRHSGDLLVREPMTPGMAGRRFPESPAFGGLLPPVRRAVALATSPIDGTRRLVALRRLSDPDLVIITGVDMAAVAASWARRFAVQTIAVLAVVAVLAAFLRQHLRLLGREEAAQRDLAHSESRFRLLAEHSTDAITRLGNDGRVRYVSPSVSRLLGYDPADLIGTEPQERCHPEDLPRLLTARDCLMQGDRDVLVTWRARRKDGRHVWLESICHVVTHGPSGREIIISSRNIDERRRVEEALRVASDVRAQYAGLLEAVIGSLPDALLLIDGDRRITLANPAACQSFAAYKDLIGCDAASLGGVLPEDPGGEDEMPVFVCRYSRCDGGVFMGETVMRRVSGQGLAAGTLMLIRDVSEAVVAARTLNDARRAAEQANAAKSRFLAAASHDLRQPLHAVGLLVDSLARRVRGAEEIGLVDDVQRSLASVEEMFGHLLDMSRLDSGGIRSETADIPVMRVLDRVARQARPMAAEKGLRLRVVPSAAVVRSDPVLLERILRNLVINAIRNTAHGGVVVGCRGRGGALSLEVWDSGRGIAADQLDAIFLEFYRIKGRRDDERRGLGLGLTIVQRLGRLLEHPLTVASAPGRGSVFRVMLPRGDAAAVATDHEALLAAGDLGGTLVAVLDDDAEVLRSTCRLLRDWGCRVTAATTLDELQRRLRAGVALDMIVADYQLAADLTGFDAVERLRARFGAALPALIITANTDADLVRQARRHDCKLLHKPLRPSRLRSMLTLLRHPLPEAME